MDEFPWRTLSVNLRFSHKLHVKMSSTNFLYNTSRTRLSRVVTSADIMQQMSFDLQTPSVDSQHRWRSFNFHNTRFYDSIRISHWKRHKCATLTKNMLIVVLKKQQQIDNTFEIRYTCMQEFIFYRMTEHLLLKKIILPTKKWWLLICFTLIPLLCTVVKPGQ